MLCSLVNSSQRTRKGKKKYSKADQEYGTAFIQDNTRRAGTFQPGKETAQGDIMQVYKIMTQAEKVNRELIMEGLGALHDIIRQQI